MTIAKGDPATRRSHVPNDGTAEAAAIERARKGMLHEGRELAPLLASLYLGLPCLAFAGLALLSQGTPWRWSIGEV
jgi:hypothetical protein